MRLYSYVVARDYGFAPNPFYGICTLATCKPKIRAVAQPGDWVIGTGSKEDDCQRQLVYAMKVSEIQSFDEYWNDPRFRSKRPNLSGSRKQAFGDNIYHSDGDEWAQANSHHSCSSGLPNPNNIRRDTSVDRVLIADRFAYFGAVGKVIPVRFDICKKGPGHRCRFAPEFVAKMDNWLVSLDPGYHATPADWSGMTWTPWHKLVRRGP